MSQLGDLLETYEAGPTAELRHEILEFIRGDNDRDHGEDAGVIWALKDDPEALQEALYAGINPEAPAKMDFPVLEAWPDSLPTAAIRALVRHGAHVVYEDPGNGDAETFHSEMTECALICAVKANRPEVVALMLEEAHPALQYDYDWRELGEERDAAGRKRWVITHRTPMGGPLHTAVHLREWFKDEPEKAARNEEIIQLLLKAGAQTSTFDELQWYKKEKKRCLLNKDLTFSYLTKEEHDAMCKVSL